jgi:hypothetical protein
LRSSWTLASPVDLLLSAIRLGDDPCDSPAMPGDDDRLAAFDLVEQPGEVGFAVRGLNFARHTVFQLAGSIGRYQIRPFTDANPFLTSRSATSCARRRCEERRSYFVAQRGSLSVMSNHAALKSTKM